MEGVSVGISDTVQLDVQYNSGDASIAVQDCSPDDGASLALWAAFRSGELTSAPAIDKPPSPSENLEMSGPSLPLRATDPSLGSPNIEMATSDKSPLEEGDCLQRPQLMEEHRRTSNGPTVVESSLVEQDHISTAVCDLSANSTPLTDHRAHSSRGSSTTDDADIEGSDSDGSPSVCRRRRTLPRTRNSYGPSPPLTLRSSAGSIDMELITALRHRRRLRKRKGMRRDSPALETNDTSAGPATSGPNGEGEWRAV